MSSANPPEQARCLYQASEVEASIDRLAAEITEQLADSKPLLLCVMNGAVPLTGLLMMRLPFALQLDYVHASRYQGARQGGTLKWLQQPQTTVRGRTVLLIDDILDEGHTLAGIRQWCLEQGAGAVYTVVLVDKRHDRRCPTLPKADFTGLEAPDRYLFGYGMDYQEYWRNAAGIYALD